AIWRPTPTSRTVSSLCSLLRLRWLADVTRTAKADVWPDIFHRGARTLGTEQTTGSVAQIASAPDNPLVRSVSFGLYPLRNIAGEIVDTLGRHILDRDTNRAGAAQVVRDGVQVIRVGPPGERAARGALGRKLPLGFERQSLVLRTTVH